MRDGDRKGGRERLSIWRFPPRASGSSSSSACAAPMRRHRRGGCVELCMLCVCVCERESVCVCVVPSFDKPDTCVCDVRARALPTGAPCAIAGMFGCAPAASDEEYNRFDGMHPDDGHAWLVAHPFY